MYASHVICTWALTVVVQGTRSEKLLLAIGNKNLGTEQEIPIVEERKWSMAGKIASSVRKLLPKSPFCSFTTDFGVPAPVAMNHVEPCHVGARRYGVLIDAKPSRIREVRTDVCHALENVLVTRIAGNGNLGFEGRVRDVRHASKRC